MTPIQQMLLGTASASGISNLAELFGVNPNSSTSTFCQVLSGTYTCTYTEPTNGWSDFPKNDSGTFISGWGITTADNGGLYKVGYSANGFTDLSSTVTACTSATSTASNIGYNAADMTNFSNGNSGAYFGSNGRQQGYNYSHWDAVFSSGFGNNIGFVAQFWGSSTSIQSGYHKTPLIRVVCNNIGRVFAPKGKFQHTTSTDPWNTGGRSQCAFYPTIYDSPTGNTSTNFDSWTGYTAPASAFEY